MAVLTKKVSDAHLAGLRQEGVSYIFGGEQDLDLRLALEILCTGNWGLSVCCLRVVG